MPDLILDTDRQQYQDLSRDFAVNEIAPHAHDCDHRSFFPLQIYKKAWEIGLVNVRLPEKLGGLGLGVLDACVIAEEFGAACPAISSAIWGNDLAVAPLLVAGNEAQQKAFLEPLLGQFGLAGYCFPAESTVSYTCKGNTFELNGAAIAVNAKQATWLLVSASGKGAAEDKGRTLFVVPTESIKELVPAQPAAALGLKCADIRAIQFQAVQVAADNLIGTAGGAQPVIDHSRAFVYPVLASYSVGIMRSALEHSVRYAKERHTMGSPIANHQAVAFMLADMARDCQAARFMARKAAWLADNGQADLQAACMARLFAGDAAMKSTTDAVQVFGGYGYSREYPVEKLMRDAKSMQVYEFHVLSEQTALGRRLLASAR